MTALLDVVVSGELGELGAALSARYVQGVIVGGRVLRMSSDLVAAHRAAIRRAIPRVIRRGQQVGLLSTLVDEYSAEIRAVLLFAASGAPIDDHDASTAVLLRDDLQSIAYMLAAAIVTHAAGDAPTWDALPAILDESSHLQGVLESLDALAGEAVCAGFAAWAERSMWEPPRRLRHVDTWQTPAPWWIMVCRRRWRKRSS